MTEKILQFVWQHQLFNSAKLETTDGEPIRIIKIGRLNTDAGPDFLQAHIYISNTLWVGNIEIHIKSSDWLRHKHEHQKEYNSVILHVVSEHDSEITPQHGNCIPTCIIPISKHIIENYNAILSTTNQIICKSKLPLIDTFHQNSWFSRLLVERFESKTNTILAIYYETNQNWEETMYRVIAKNFGFKTNSDTFLRLASSTPISILLKHSNSLLQIEAILFGQAGLLFDDFTEEYPLLLQKEYEFLSKKYSLTSIYKEEWKFGRMRPSNLPTIRIAEFSQFVYENQSIVSKILACTSIDELKKIFSISLHTFWDTHYTFSKISKCITKQIGEQSIESIIINSVIPLLFAYGTVNSEEYYKQLALDFLEKLPSEKNTIISKWEDAEIQSHSAFRSQALLQLYNEYCCKGKCLQCVFGVRWFKKMIEN